MDSSCWTDVSLNKNRGWRWREGGILLAGLMSLSSLANELEWKDGGLRTPQDSMERSLDKSRCFGVASHKLKRLRRIVLRKLEN